ncbi:hypothetical protein PG985_003839 [Apiospora marii]|uniref:uncharacterized protein n=1 Tax=Apiospora marii TaxID=335849 RepID=UPI00312E5554
MGGLSLVNHAPLRIFDEEQVMVTHCKAVIDPEGCQGEMVNPQYVKWCEKHAKQERAIYHFRKSLEAIVDGIKGLKNRDNPEEKRVALILLSIVIVAREAQRDWFFPGENDESHIKHELIVTIWQKLEGLEFVELLDHRTSTPAQLANPNCEYIEDVHATDPENVDWNAVRQDP